MTTRNWRSFFAALAISQASASLPSADLSGCQSFARTFDNTCRKESNGNAVPVGDYTAWASTDQATVTCTGEMRCPGGSGSQTFTSQSPCTFTR